MFHNKHGHIHAYVFVRENIYKLIREIKEEDDDNFFDLIRHN